MFSPCCKGFLWLLQFPPVIKRRVFRENWQLLLPMIMCACVSSVSDRNLIQGIPLCLGIDFKPMTLYVVGRQMGVYLYSTNKAYNNNNKACYTNASNTVQEEQLSIHLWISSKEDQYFCEAATARLSPRQHKCAINNFSIFRQISLLSLEGYSCRSGLSTS